MRAPAPPTLESSWTCRSARAAGAAALLLAASGLMAPMAASPLDECWSVSANRVELGSCLDDLAAAATAELERTYQAAVAAQADLDAITGTDRSSRTLDQAQRAYALYRDLDCQLVELQMGAGTGAGDQYRACRIELDRARTARLQALLPVDTTADEAAMTIRETSWTATTVDGEPVSDGVEITLAIDEADGVAGRGGCNRYFGRAEIDGQNITMAGMGSTRMACPEPEMAAESRYLAALERVAGWRVEGDTLTLEDAEGETVLTFTRGE